MELSLMRPKLYRVKRGQTLSSVAATFGLTPRVLSAANALERELWEGQVLVIPPQTGNLYAVRGGESKTLLCGSEEAFEKKNATRHLYVGQTVAL